MNKKKILAFATGPIFGGALSFAVLPLVAWYFPPEDIGRNNVFQIFISFSILLLVLGLDQAYVREFHEVGDRRELLKACVLPGAIFLFLLIGVTLPFSEEIAKLLYGKEESHWYLITILCVICSFVSRYFSLVLRMQERGLAYSASQVLPKFAVLCIIGGYILFDARKIYTNLLYANLISIFLVTLIFGWNTKEDWVSAIRLKVSWDDQKKLLQFGAPLIGAGLAYWGLTATSTVALRTFSDFHELGIYSMAMSFAGVAVIFQSIFSTVWMPTVYKWVANKEDLNKIDDVTEGVAFFVCLIFCFVGTFSWIVKYILPPEYEAVHLLLTCCMAQPLLYTLSEATVVGINVRRKSMHALGIALLALACNAIFSALLTPRFGAVGAAISNALAYLIFFAARTEISARLWRASRRRPLYLMMLWMISSSVCIAFFYDRLLVPPAAIWISNLFMLFLIFGKKMIAIFERSRKSSSWD